MTRAQFIRKFLSRGLSTAGVLVIALLSAGAANAQVSVTHTYDSLGRLTGTVYNDGGGDLSYTYDAAGNRTGSTAVNVPPLYAVTAPAAPATEGGDLVFTVTRTGDTAPAQTIDYATVDTGGGSATAGSDYVATAGTLDFAAGQATATITIGTSCCRSPERRGRGPAVPPAAPFPALVSRRAMG